MPEDKKTNRFLWISIAYVVPLLVVVWCLRPGSTVSPLKMMIIFLLEGSGGLSNNVKENWNYHIFQSSGSSRAGLKFERSGRQLLSRQA